ncbi:hypothetical protein Mapa_001706 [Marchantia paleacea]|nr:hypothetical protein Mapa_001706 [Marchantia paleacea]
MHLQLGSVNAVVASSPEMAEIFLKTQDHLFASRPLCSENFLLMVTTAPLGPLWRSLRRICAMELFSPKRIASFQVLEYPLRISQRTHNSVLHDPHVPSRRKC